MDLGRAILRMRTALGYSQIDFATACDLDRNTIHRVETNSGNLNKTSINKVLRILNLTEDELFFIALDGPKLYGIGSVQFEEQQNQLIRGITTIIRRF